ncbi:universal stress protein [Saccharopolyspora flava]|uniref:Nucleotide-binding universal stress protein, UspA family n=1 Tax=Saccharopolyspora flava TaxID=95161 RepID=A0A1I6TLE1_9PSEU|nr:universal stress protein [Saccharopolyspora flava]SFS89827.1 Nucleotide-binding universal stress protein, UspA family [Saccharopolyspora flava]
MTDLSNAIVVGIDGSDQALSAAAWAASVASARKLSLYLVTSTEPYFRGFYGAGMPVPPDAFAEIDELARTHLSAATDRVNSVASGLEFTTEYTQEQPVALLLRMAKEARMLALGASGHGGFGGMLLGSTAVSAAAHAACPVAVVREPSAPGGPVVAGVDGSDNSTEALAAAFAEAAWRGVGLVAVHASREPSIREVGLGHLEPEMATSERVLAEALAGLQQQHPDVPVERVTVNERPRDTLIERSRSAQLVVVGSRGRGGFLGMLLGSTSQALLHHAECPVLVVHPSKG